MREDFLTVSVQSWGSGERPPLRRSVHSAGICGGSLEKAAGDAEENPEENLKIRVSEKEDITESTGISEESEDERKFILNTGEIVAYLIRARLAGEDPGKLAYGFHRALADEILAACEEAERQTGIRKVALSGGVFQNRLLLELVDDGLTEMGFEVLKHSLIPPNDGGIALGQAVYGMAYVQRHR